MNVITRSDGGGVLLINEGNPVILESIHLMSASETGNTAALTGYVLLQNMQNSEYFYKWLEGYNTAGNNCLFTFDPGLYIPSLRLVKGAADQVVLIWRNP